MTGLGMILAFALGYSILYWAINSIQGKTQDPFMSYLFPWGS